MVVFVDGGDCSSGAEEDEGVTPPSEVTRGDLVGGGMDFFSGHKKDRPYFVYSSSECTMEM